MFSGGAGFPMKPLVIVGVLGLLAVAMVAQIFIGPRSLPGRGVHLAAALPSDLAGWTSKSVKLGATEALQGSVEQVLQFDDVFFREFQSARGEVSLYVAYWGPAKMPTQVVASHTPDRCWTSAGWNCDETKHRSPLTAGARDLRPGEWRLFRAPNGERLHVQYWHLVGGALYDYGDRFNQMPSAWRWWREVAKQAVSTPLEQYFIRLTSNRPFADLQGDPGFQEVLRALAGLGLALPPKAEG